MLRIRRSVFDTIDRADDECTTIFTCLANGKVHLKYFLVWGAFAILFTQVVYLFTQHIIKYVIFLISCFTIEKFIHIYNMDHI